MPDVDGDGRGDLLLAAYSESVDGVFRAGRAYCFSGATGLLLHTLESEEPTRHGQFGLAVAGLPDIDGDGRGELGVAAMDGPGFPYYVAGRRVHVFSGATGQRLFSLRPPPETTDYGESIAGVADLDEDGRGDGVVGTPNAGGGPQSAGVVYRYQTDGRFGAGWAGEAVVPAAEPAAETAASLALSAAPNPVGSAATIGVELPRPAEAVVEVLDVLGRRVALVYEGAMGAGAHALHWAPPSDLPGGVYLLRLQAGGRRSPAGSPSSAEAGV